MHSFSRRFTFFGLFTQSQSFLFLPPTRKTRSLPHSAGATQEQRPHALGHASFTPFRLHSFSRRRSFAGSINQKQSFLLLPLRRKTRSLTHSVVDAGAVEGASEVSVVDAGAAEGASEVSVVDAGAAEGASEVWARTGLVD